MRHFIQHLHDSMEHDLKETIQAIRILVPQTKLFESNRNGRAILPFIGSMAKGLFGLATMSDVQLLANHINALNAKSRSITQALQQHSDHLSSFVKVIDKRTSNLMQGIKDNSLEIQTIAHSFQLAIVSSEQSMHNRCTSLVLEVTCGGDCVVIPILDLSLCPSYYGFSRPSVLDLTVASFPSCKMFAVWSSFEVTNKLTQKFVKIPTTLTLSFLQSYRIKKVLAQPFNAYIYVTHQGFATMLSQPANVSKQTVQALAADSDSLYPSLLA
ncbi:Hypothetical predicted protein [Mytilus galloprovincialis]|uniref:Uncharacterized protein n=1 Tax=Mytilus galloprovincialis TaxID=29158 RepID=A0A8B6CVR0_MYTGA|nr:Hypothetical predicted protein [Mytilus galloprovincialis]